MFCTTECWNCEDKSCEHYKSKQEIYFENKKLKGVIETYEILIKSNNINNWNELKKWLETIIENLEKSQTLRFNHSIDFKLKAFKDSLDKMQELEGNNE